MSYENIIEIKEFLDTKRMDKSYKTISNYELAINKFFDYFNVNNLDDIKAIDTPGCRNYLAQLQKDSIKNNSINAYLRPIKTLFNWLIENEYLDKSPVAKVKYLRVPKGIPNFLSTEEVSQLIDACKKVEDEVIIALLITTGLRRNELVSLKLEDYQDSHILVHGKGSKERRLVLHPDVCDALDEYIIWRNKKYGNCSEYLLVSKMRGKYAGESIRGRLLKIAKDAGFSEERLKEIHVHMTRHTYAADMIESGADLKIIQSGLGHSSLTTTANIYAHVRSSALDAAMLNQPSILKRR